MSLSDLIARFGERAPAAPSPLDSLSLPPLPPGPPPREKKPPKVRPLVILDIETDPFLYGRVPRPFAVGLYTPEDFQLFWGPDCVRLSVIALRVMKPSLVYAHNGGGFDIKGYYQEYLEGRLKIINGRIVSCMIGKQEIRDSYAIMPFPLRDYAKDEIDYGKFEAGCRDRHRAEIVAYLKADCRYLYDLVSTFHTEFGQTKLTIGSTAMEQIQKLHSFANVNISFDRDIRPKYFFGGRNQCFQSGIMEGDWHIYDVNSMYPWVMKSFKHPIGDDFTVGSEITPETCFLDVVGANHAAFLSRTRDGLDFTARAGEFSTSIHEYRAAVETGAFTPSRVIRTYDFWEQGSFGKFVDKFYELRQNSRAAGDAIRPILYKYVLNSGYGKFSQNPANFYDWMIARTQPEELCKHCKGSGECRDCFKCEAINDYEPTDGMCMHCEGGGYRWILHEFDHSIRMYRAHTGVHHFYNVATGASITGGARSILLRGLRDSDTPVYCDTDSIICKGFRGRCDASELGAWKHEGAGSLVAIAGKKTYAVFASHAPRLTAADARRYPWMLEPIRWRGARFWCVKKAHKGARLSPAEILEIAGGKTIEYPNPVPHFQMGAGAKGNPGAMFITRRIRRTAEA